jgi:citrate lyase subunit beta / citryl-CoA lyase
VPLRGVDLKDEIAAFERRGAELVDRLGARRARLPLRLWRQQAHLTAPAERDVATKALHAGTAGMARIMDRFGISPEDLAERMGADPVAVCALLERPRAAPLVVIDAEDALALTDVAVEEARSVTVDVLANAVSDPDGVGPLRFFRPPGLALGGTAHELFTLLAGLVDRSRGDALPLDGIVFPKIEHPEEVELVHDMLTRSEQVLGIPVASIRTAFLVESAWAVSQLDRIAVRASDRLCALIFGLADYSADLGLPAVSSDHAVADWARACVVNVSAAVGVPAIDGMTLAYPVADRTLDAAANRERILERMALVHADAVRAREMGMLGKWVGHPAQLFAVLLAYDAAFTDEALEKEAAKLSTYHGSVHSAGKGATIIDGVMSDRATDRHARALLRQAVALGRFDAARASSLGVIDDHELNEAMVMSPSQGGGR